MHSAWYKIQDRLLKELLGLSLWGCQGEVFLRHCWSPTGHYMPRHTGAENVINRTRHTVVKSHAEYKEVSLCPFQPPGEVHLR